MAGTDLWALELACREEGYSPVCGCDEAGAGPLAGPVYAAAVILPFGVELPGLNDSKKLTEKKREALFPMIREQAVAWAVARVEAAEIDETDILSARMKAMQLAIDRLTPAPDFALTTPHRCIIKGDSLSASIAAASILAKVSRDRLMVELDELYPGYGFARHKGYGTAQHREAIARLGPCPIHRLTFLKHR